MILPTDEGTSRVRTIAKRGGDWQGMLTALLFELVPGAGLEPATFGCLRHHKGFARHTIALKAAL